MIKNLKSKLTSALASGLLLMVLNGCSGKQEPLFVDLDGDGKLDLVYQTRTNQGWSGSTYKIVVRYNKGDRTFSDEIVLYEGDVEPNGIHIEGKR